LECCDTFAFAIVVAFDSASIDLEPLDKQLESPSVLVDFNLSFNFVIKNYFSVFFKITDYFYKRNIFRF